METTVRTENEWRAAGGEWGECDRCGEAGPVCAHPDGWDTAVDGTQGRTWEGDAPVLSAPGSGAGCAVCADCAESR